MNKLANITFYVSQRGRVTQQRPYRDLDALEREQILEDYLILGTQVTLERWKISRQTLGHLKYHYREALAEIEDQHFAEHGI